MYHDGLWVAVERSAEFERAKEGETDASRKSCEAASSLSGR